MPRAPAFGPVLIRSGPFPSASAKLCNTAPSRSGTIPNFKRETGGGNGDIALLALGNKRFEPPEWSNVYASSNEAYKK
jgi:hypothetical protein